MTNVVLDTNVLISGFLWEGTPKKCLDGYRFASAYQLLFSPELIHEFRTKLLRKFHIPSQRVNLWVKEITMYAELVNPTYTTRICRDPKDNMLLDTAGAGRASYIVTGDKDLLTLLKFNSIQIVSPKTFLGILQKVG